MTSATAQKSAREGGPGGSPPGTAPGAAKLSGKTQKSREPRTDRTLAWLAAFFLLLVTLGLWGVSRFVLDAPSPQNPDGPGGDTLAGYALGGISVFCYGLVTLYAWRRSKRIQKRGMMRAWMEVHLAFGLVAGIAAVLHSGPKLGAPIHGAFLIAFLLLVGTGFLGKMISMVVPRRLTSIEEESLLVEDVVDRQKAMRLEVDQLAADLDEKLRALADDVIPVKIKSPLSYGKRRMKRVDIVEEIYADIGGDQAVPAEKRDDIRRIIVCLVEDKFLAKQLMYHYMLRGWLPVHIALTTLCIPWLIFHVVTVFLF